jgi:hypothetical protein
MATPENRPAAPAPRPVVLELRSLEKRYPKCGKALLHALGPSTVFRLGHDPVGVSDGSRLRPVTVDRRPPGGVTPFEQSVIIGWDGDSVTRDQATKIQYIHNEHRLTEFAAIGVMLLLINELEGATYPGVLQIGAGGDYLMSLPDGSEVQVEVSGIRIDASGSDARRRLVEKCDQVLTTVDRGFASVTTFSYRNGDAAHSYLHHVARPTPTARNRSPSKSSRKRRKK